MRTVSSTLATLAAAGSAVVLALAGPALAAGTTYTIKAGTQSSGTVPYTASSGQITFKTSTGLTLNCSSASAAGAFTLSTKSKGTKAATVTSTTFTGCTGPGGIPLTVAQVGTWAINITGAPVNGVTPGSITKVGANVKDTNGGSQCAFSVKGLVNGNFNQNSQTLNVVPPASTPYPLTISKVKGCFALINNGDTASYSATYAVSNNVGPITITKN